RRHTRRGRRREKTLGGQGGAGGGEERRLCTPPAGGSQKKKPQPPPATSQRWISRLRSAAARGPGARKAAGWEIDSVMRRHRATRPRAATGQGSIVSCPRQAGRTAKMETMEHALRSDGPYGPLRRDVRLLGSLLGRVLVEQEGEDFLAAEERVRATPRRPP